MSNIKTKIKDLIQNLKQVFLRFFVCPVLQRLAIKFRQKQSATSAFQLAVFPHHTTRRLLLPYWKKSG